jgi:hypothetical protein
VLDFCEHKNNELKCHVKGGTYTDQLRNYQLLNNVFVAWSLSDATKESHVLHGFILFELFFLRMLILVAHSCIFLVTKAEACTMRKAPSARMTHLHTLKSGP